MKYIYATTDTRTVYINGIKADKDDIARLEEDIAEGFTIAYGHITKDGYLDIITIV